MKVLEIDIKLDPVNDGARLIETKAIHKDEGARHVVVVIFQRL